jgi:hypothetical protein
MRQSIGTSTLGNNSLSPKANNHSTYTRIISTHSFRDVEFAGVHVRDFLVVLWGGLRSGTARGLIKHVMLEASLWQICTLCMHVDPQLFMK